VQKIGIRRSRWERLAAYSIMLTSGMFGKSVQDGNQPCITSRPQSPYSQPPRSSGWLRSSTAGLGRSGRLAASRGVRPGASHAGRHRICSRIGMLLVTGDNRSAMAAPPCDSSHGRGFFYARSRPLPSPRPDRSS
jgi:hypothetical protein